MIESTASQELPLAGLRVGISGSVPEREYWGPTVDLDRLILGFVSRLSGFVMQYGGTIVHGSHPAFAPVIAEQALELRRMGGAGPAAGRPNPLRLFASQFFGEVPEGLQRAARRSAAEVILTPRFGPKGTNSAVVRNDSLTAMRVAMTGQVDVLVAIGGKLQRDTGFNPGVLEELAIMRWYGIPCFVVAGFGGLERTMLHQFSEGNLLSQDEVDQMAMRTKSGEEYVGTLLAHFARHRDALRRSELSPVWQIDLRPGPSVPGAAQSQIAEVKPANVHKIVRRFARLK